MHCGNGTHVEDKAECIVGVSGNHDNSDTRVGERKIGALFLQCSPVQLHHFADLENHSTFYFTKQILTILMRCPIAFAGRFLLNLARTAPEVP